MRKILFLLLVCVLFSACQKTYSYEDFYNDPEMTKAYIEKWQNDPKANQEQLSTARNAYTARALETMTPPAPSKPFETPTFGSGK